ncbi:CUE domain-containing protein [Bacillus shivajii]|uniref:CUE domain-containing protein n=1 Tax=Bacillus shivajii TaxID=1983719 RepID=UPI001CFA11B3|nr:CUE domain-containing protein [Bacillus shivajii]UCZ53549.1 CUE domain-containing protein [Bacillus shivajii]
MKKMIIGVLSLGLVFGAGASIVAASEDGFPGFEDGVPKFEEMLPFMQQMHPNWSDDDLESMYNACHGEDGNRGPGMMGSNFGNE